jgi:predicted RND superfamily exporter protein
MQVENAFVTGTVSSLSLALLSALLAMLVFTRNWVLALLAVLAMASTILLMLAFFVVNEWPLGAVEAVSLSIIVGLSVDYTLHLGHAYNRCPHPDRRHRITAAVRETGGSLLASCATSVGSMLVLTLCVIRIFVVMGTIVAVTITLSVAIALGPLTAALLLVGPQVASRLCSYLA